MTKQNYFFWDASENQHIDRTPALPSSTEPRNKKTPTFHYTTWLIGILMSWFTKCSQHIWVFSSPINLKQLPCFLFMAQLGWTGCLFRDTHVQRYQSARKTSFSLMWPYNTSRKTRRQQKQLQTCFILRGVYYVFPSDFLVDSRFCCEKDPWNVTDCFVFKKRGESEG